MSLLWFRTASDRAPWHDADPEAFHDGVENFGDMTVAHPDDTPWHNNALMDTARKTHGPWNPHGSDYEAMQAWLEPDTLDHFMRHPEKMSDSPVSVIHDEDTGEHFLLDGHHRAVVARHLGSPSHLPAEFLHVSRSRM